MQLRTLLASTSIVAAALMAGCPSDGGGGVTPPFAEVQRILADGACAQRVACLQGGFMPALQHLIDAHAPAGACADELVRLGRFDYRSLTSAVQGGRIVLDPAAAQRCADAAAASCVPIDDLATQNADCRAMLTGQLAMDAPCHRSEECADGLFCYLSTSGVCSGTCIPTATVGQACTPSQICDPNYVGGPLSCEATAANATNHCVEHATTTVGVGATCGAIDATSDHQVQAVCDAGLFCQISSGATGTCVAALAASAPCTLMTDACAGDSVCVPSMTPGQASCTAFAITSQSGAACGPTALAECNPYDRLDCVGGICTTVGTGAVGQPCRVEVPTDCDSGLFCDDSGASPVCAALIAAGRACDPARPDGCSSGYCDATGATPVCGAFPLCNGG